MVEQLSEVRNISLAVQVRSAQVQITTAYEGLDTHTVVQQFRASGGEQPVLEAVLASEPGLVQRSLPPALWRGGGAPILAVQVGVPVGQETLEVPAASFECAQYKIGDADVWLSPRVSPYGIVTYKAPGITLELAAYEDNLEPANR